MNETLKITFKNSEKNSTVTNFIENKFNHLKRFSSNIIRCHVIVAASHKKHSTNTEYEITANLIIPGKESTGKGKTDPDSGIDLLKAISNAFSGLESQLKHRNSRLSAMPKFLRNPEHIMVKSNSSQSITRQAM
jgi:ribosomal subunit interface protein